MADAIASYSMVLQQIAHRAAYGEHRESRDNIVGIVFSALWLEAYLNELADQIRWRRDNARRLPKVLIALADVFDELEERRAQLPEKVQIWSAVLTGSTFPKGEYPYQDFDLLLALRNRLAHARPQTSSISEEAGGIVWHDEPKKLRRGLVDRGFIPRTGTATSMPWFMAIRKPGVAPWAFETSYEMARTVAECLPRRTWRRWGHERNQHSPEAKAASKGSKPLARPER